MRFGAILSVLSLVLTACASFPREGTHALVGTWANRAGTKLTIRPGGTFDAFARNPRGGKIHVWGNYTVAGDEVTFRGSGGNEENGCEGPGVYHFQRVSADTLGFELVGDRCRSRSQNLSLTWHTE
jgi:hypothetical protein